MIAWFRVDASAEIGAGHLMRCLALAQALTEQHVECRFLVRSPTTTFCKDRPEWCWKLLEIPGELAQDSEQSWLQDNCDFTTEDIFILDGYQFSAAYINALQSFNMPVIVFDDNNNRGKLVVQLVINGAANATDLNYQDTMPDAKLCLGAEFRLLRGEFRNELPQSLSQRHSIAIIMGGTDPKGLIIPLLTELQTQHNEIPVRVLINNNYPELDRLQRTISECHFAVQLMINGPDLANVFNNAKLVISAAGGTQFELLAMHTPAILLSVADNQISATQYSAKQGWCEHFDCRSHVPYADIVRRTAQLLGDFQQLQYMHFKAQEHADLNGAERLLDAVLELPRAN